LYTFINVQNFKTILFLHYKLEYIIFILNMSTGFNSFLIINSGSSGGSGSGSSSGSGSGSCDSRGSGSGGGFSVCVAKLSRNICERICRHVRSDQSL
jgi:uncharacterized membrane protein